MRNIIFKHKRYVIFVLCILFVLAAHSSRGRIADNISTEKPWDRWSGSDIKNGYVAAYIPEKEGLDEETIIGYTGTYKSSLQEESFEESDNKRLYLDAYSCESQLEVSKELGSTPVKVNVTAVGGDFFFFHPMQLLSGNYIDKSNLMHDGVVLDENTAWSLYGSSNIQGKTCVINNKYYYIAGVVKESDSKYAKRTYGSRSRMFMHFDEYKKMDDTAVITSYEMIYPELITGRAEKVMKSLFNIQDAEEQVEGSIENESLVEIVDMTRRYNFTRLLGVAKDYGYRSSGSKGILYPFWENECRMAEDYAAIWALLELIFGIIAGLLLVPDIVRVYKVSVGFCEKQIAQIKERFS